MVLSTISEIRYIDKTENHEYQSDEYDDKDSDSEQDYEDDTINIGISTGVIESTIENENDFTLVDCVSTNYTGSVMTFIVLLIMSIFVCNEYSSGYIKNTIMIPKHRWYANISKLVTAFIVIVIENIVAIILFVFSLLVIFKNGSIGNIVVLCKYLSLQILLNLGLCAFIIMVCNLFRSKSVSIVIAISVAIQLITLPVLGIFCDLMGVKYSIVSKFLMSIKSRVLPIDITGRVAIETLILGIGGIAVYTVLSNIIIKMKDI
jgi:ABC-type transport system involved in multi-copper enzyme maturation permease subunit